MAAQFMISYVEWKKETQQCSHNLGLFLFQTEYQVRNAGHELTLHPKVTDSNPPSSLSSKCWD